MVGGRRNDRETLGQLSLQGGQSPHPQLKAGSDQLSRHFPAVPPLTYRCRPLHGEAWKGSSLQEADTVWAAQPEHVEIIYVFK